MARYYNDFNDIRGSDDELMHYGVQGMKWGVRRYQNKDGSLTAEGKKEGHVPKPNQESLGNA